MTSTGGLVDLLELQHKSKSDNGSGRLFSSTLGCVNAAATLFSQTLQFVCDEKTMQTTTWRL